MTEIKINSAPHASQASGGGAPGGGPSAPSSGAVASDEGTTAPFTAGRSSQAEEGSRRDGAGASSPSRDDDAAGATAHDEDAHAPDITEIQIEGELDELVKTTKQRDDYLALAQRTQADFENYRKRVARDAAAARDRGVGSLAKELLPALDNLDRALDAAAENDPLLQGVRLVRSELKGALARAGIESFCPLGEQFDPSVHEAVATAQAPDGQASGTVVEVYQDGYRLGEGILRPARVVVAA
jgi:molecular chaperone GrpE